MNDVDNQEVSDAVDEMVDRLDAQCMTKADELGIDPDDLWERITKEVQARGY